MLIRILTAMCLALATPTLAGQAETAAILGVVFTDTSTEGDYFGERKDESERIVLLQERLAEVLVEKGYRLIDTAPVEAEIDSIVNIANSNGLDGRLAKQLGADVAVTAEVQKVSNLILTINVLVRAAETGTLLRAGNADIRSNTDESWLRGLNYVLKNRIFRAGPIMLE